MGVLDLDFNESIISPQAGVPYPDPGQGGGGKGAGPGSCISGPPSGCVGCCVSPPDIVPR